MITTRSLAIAAVAALTMLAIPAPASASPTEFPPTGSFQIKSLDPAHPTACATLNPGWGSENVSLAPCSKTDPKQQWEWNPKTSQLKNVGDGKCAYDGSYSLPVVPCPSKVTWTHDQQQHVTSPGGFCWSAPSIPLSSTPIPVLPANCRAYKGHLTWEIVPL